MDKRNWFVFYRWFYEAICELPDEDKLKIFIWICEFSFEWKNTEFLWINKAIWSLILPQLEANNKRFEDWRKWWRPSKENQWLWNKKTSGYENKKPKEKDKEKDKEKEKVKEKEKYFELFWEKYPRKENKKKAYDVFMRIIDSVSIETIISWLEAYCKTENVVLSRFEYVKHPTTWLNWENWNDKYIPYEEWKNNYKTSPSSAPPLQKEIEIPDCIKWDFMAELRFKNWWYSYKDWKFWLDWVEQTLYYSDFIPTSKL